MVLGESPPDRLYSVGKLPALPVRAREKPVVAFKVQDAAGLRKPPRQGLMAPLLPDKILCRFLAIGRCAVEGFEDDHSQP